ncbi:MAG: hypothetical protein ACRC42_04935 [Mycoplasma sp.]
MKKSKLKICFGAGSALAISCLIIPLAVSCSASINPTPGTNTLMITHLGHTSLGEKFQSDDHTEISRNIFNYTKEKVKLKKEELKESDGYTNVEYGTSLSSNVGLSNRFTLEQNIEFTFKKDNKDVFISRTAKLYFFFQDILDDKEKDITYLYSHNFLTSEVHDELVPFNKSGTMNLSNIKELLSNWKNNIFN